ncbi:MAG: hypothetical protein WC714_29205 [Candidatus Obscuribacterales bacterium]|jgi:hypothetical protein
MATSGDKETIAIAAGADLSTFQYKIIAVDGTLAATNAVALGVLLNKPKSGEHATIAYAGHMKAYVGGGSVAAGAQLAVTTSGYLITNATSTGGIVGKAITAAASGALCEFVGNFATVRNSYSIGII